MPHQLHVGDFIVGGMLLVSSAFAYIVTRKHPEHIRGLTYKQYAACCIIGIAGGALLIVWQFILPR
jgi:hypothetical protein